MTNETLNHNDIKQQLESKSSVVKASSAILAIFINIVIMSMVKNMTDSLVKVVGYEALYEAVYNVEFGIFIVTVLTVTSILYYFIFYNIIHFSAYTLYGNQTEFDE